MINRDVFRDKTVFILSLVLTLVVISFMAMTANLVLTAAKRSLSAPAPTACECLELDDAFD